MCVSTKVYISKLKTLLSSTDDQVDWKPFNLLRLWLLFFGMLESRKEPEVNWYTDSVSMVAERLEVVSWDSIVAAVKGVLWFEDIFDSEIEKFRAGIIAR